MTEPSGARPMRRASREVTDPAALRAILQEATVLFLGLHDEPAPYVLPVNFAHEGDTLYVHSAGAGTKLDLMRARPLVGFSASTQPVLVTGAAACDYGCHAASVVGTGTARIVTDGAERARALAGIMRHYGGPEAAALPFKAETLGRTTIVAIDIVTLRGKRTG